MQKAELNWGRGEGPAEGIQLGLSMGKAVMEINVMFVVTY